MASHPELADVRAAAKRIGEIARRTPLLRSEELSNAAGHSVWLKVESEQVTGSFKVRGAANALLQLSDEERAAGVVAVSSGNHGRAVAHVSRELGIAATICISERVPAIKVEAIRALGAEVVVAGADQDAADEAARQRVADGMTFIHPFDDPRVIAGQGTIALEVLDEIDAAQIVVPLSGGGLAGGIALAAKAVQPAVEMIGVSQDRGPAMVRTLAAGHLVDVVEQDTLADALAGSLGPENHHSVHLCGAFLDDTVLVSEQEIGSAMAFLSVSEGLTIEGGAAVGVAALRAGKLAGADPTVIVLSGGNVAAETIERLVAR